MVSILSQAKSEAQIPGSSGRFFSLENEVFVMSGKSSSGGVTYTYVFEGKGIKFYIHSNPSCGIQPVRVRYGAECLIGQDLFSIHRNVCTFLETLGFTIEQEKISRVDMQVMVERDVSEFMQILLEGRAVCTAQKWSFHGKGFSRAAETFTLGRGGIQVRIYDKRQELFDNVGSEPHKFVLMVLNCFGEDWLVDGTPTTRIEFQLRRDFLKDMEIHTMADLQEYEAGLAHYCCHKWFRLLKEKKKKGHTHEQETDPLWQEVQAAFEKWFPGKDGERKMVTRRYDKPLMCSSRQYVLQALGCFAKSAALYMDGGSNPKEILQFVYNAIHNNTLRLVKKTIDSSIELGVRAGVLDPYSVEDAFVVSKRCIRAG